MFGSSGISGYICRKLKPEDMKSKVLIGVCLALFVSLVVALSIYFYNERVEWKKKKKEEVERSKKVRQITGVQYSIGNIYMGLCK